MKTVITHDNKELSPNKALSHFSYEELRNEVIIRQMNKKEADQLKKLKEELLECQQMVNLHETLDLIHHENLDDLLKTYISRF